MSDTKTPEMFTYDATREGDEWVVRRGDGKTLSLGSLNSVRDAAAAIRMAKLRPHWEWG